MRAWRVSGTASSPSSPTGSNVPSPTLKQAAVGQQHPDGLDRVERDAVGPRDDRRGRRTAADPGTSPARSSRIATSESGSRSRARKLRRPAPQSGRRLEQLRRARVMMRSGTFRLHSRTWSMKSSMPGSAHWRSSNTSVTTWSAASRSKNVRQALKRPSAPPVGACRRRAGRGGPARSNGARRRRGRTWRASRRPAPGRLVIVGLDQAGPTADHLAERPERDALAVGRRTALVPPDRLDDTVDVLQEFPGQAALADAGLPVIDTSRTRARGRRVEEILEQPELGIATDERRLESVAPAEAASLGDDAQRDPGAGTGAALPLRGCSPAGSKAIALDAARWVASPTRTVPGAAADCRREAVLTRSPATMPWPIAPRVTAASPVRTPARAWSSGSSVRTASTSSSAGPDASLGIVLVGDRCAPDGHHRVADELLDRAAVPLDDIAGDVEVLAQQLADRLGVAALGQCREADQVGEQDGDDRVARRPAERRSGRGPAPRRPAAGCPATGSARGGREARPAVPAEAGGRGVQGAARGAHGRRAACRIRHRTCGPAR